MKKCVMGVVAAAVVAQIWGMISWMALPWHNMDFKQFKNEAAVADVIRAEIQGSGLYTLPNMDESIHGDEAKMAEWNERARRGPFAFMTVKADGIAPGMGLPITIGFLLNIAIALVLYWLLGKTTAQSIMEKTLFLAVCGALGSLYPHISNWNWWHFPLTYGIVGVVDLFITWALAGFVMVKISSK